MGENEGEPARLSRDENLSHVSPLRETLPYTVCVC